MKKDNASLIMLGILVIIILALLLSIQSRTLEIYGDVDGDGKITVRDALFIRKHDMGLQELTDEEFFRADLNNDNKVNEMDIIIIRNLILESRF